MTTLYLKLNCHYTQAHLFFHNGHASKQVFCYYIGGIITIIVN